MPLLGSLSPETLPQRCIERRPASTSRPALRASARRGTPRPTRPRVGGPRNRKVALRPHVPTCRGAAGFRSGPRRASAPRAAARQRAALEAQRASAPRHAAARPRASGRSKRLQSVVPAPRPDCTATCVHVRQSSETEENVGDLESLRLMSFAP